MDELEKEMLEYDKEEKEWKNIVLLKKEMRLKRNIILTTKTNEEIAEIFFDKIKTQNSLEFFYDCNIYWIEIGVESIFDFPQSTYHRYELINNLVWEKVRILKRQRKHEENEKERKESFKWIDEIIEWIKEKRLKKLSKIGLKLFLSEKKKNLIPINREALYLEVNNEIENRKRK